MSDFKEFVHDEITGKFVNDARNSFIEQFETEISDFESIIVSVLGLWMKFDSTIGDSEQKAYVSAYLLNMINSLLVSMEMLISGHSVPAGNLMRQTIESFAMAALISNGRLSYLNQLKENTFKINWAVKQVEEHINELNINAGSWEIVKKAYQQYHLYSHPTEFSLAFLKDFHSGGACMGATFDKGKLSEYKQEMTVRLSFARQLKNIIEGIIANFISV